MEALGPWLSNLNRHPKNLAVLLSHIAGVPSPEFLIQDREFGMGWGQGTGISNQFPGDADAVGPGTTL